MAIFPAFKLTKKGEELLNRCVGEGKTLTFTKIKIGDGTPSSDWRELNDVENSFKEFPILETSVQKDQTLKIKAYFDNKDFLEDKKFREVGVFVSLDTLDGEFLYSYTNAGDTADTLPAKSKGFFSRTLDILNYIGYACNVTFNIENIRNDYDFNTETEIKVATFLKSGDRIRQWGRLVQGDIQVRNGVVTSETTNFPIDNGLFVKLTGEITVSAIDELKNLKGVVVGTVINVLGYYKKDDGANHKRIMTDEDDGSGVQLANGFWANIVHSNKEDVSWYGAKLDGITNDTATINKFLNFKKYINLKGKTVKVDKINFVSGLHIENGKIITNASDNLFNYIDNDIKYAKIKNITFTGDGTQFFFGNNGGVNMENVVIEDNVIDNVRVGISIDADLDGVVKNCVIRRNKISNIKGKDSGHGYGIHMAGVKNCRIYDNVIDKAERHSIYHAWGYNNVIKNNTIKNHRLVTHDSTHRAGIAVFRKSQNITVEGNKFFNCYDCNIHIECNSLEEGRRQGQLENVRVFNNSFIEPMNFVPAIMVGNVGEAQSSTLFVKNVFIYNNYIKTTNNLTQTLVDLNSCENVYFENNFFDISTSKKLNLISLEKRFTPFFNNVYITKNIFNITNNGSEENVRCITFSLAKNPLIKFVVKNNIFNGIKEKGNYYTKIYNSISNISDFPFIDSSETTYNGIFNELWYNEGDKVYVKDFRYGEYIKVCTQKGRGNVAKFRDIKSTTEIQMLNTPYYVEKMKSEGVYNDFISYMDEKTEYDNRKRKEEKLIQEEYKQALTSNPELTYEEFMISRPMMLPVIEEPQPSEALLKFKEKYLG